MTYFYLHLRPTAPAPRREDEPMESPKPVFYFSNLTGHVNYGPIPNVGAEPIDCMNDAEIRCCHLTVEAMTELLRRRPDPAKVQAELRQERDSYREEVNAAHGVLNRGGAKADGSRLPARIAAYIEAMVSADLAQTYGANEATARESLRAVTKECDAYVAHINAAHVVLDRLDVHAGSLTVRMLRLRQMLRDPRDLDTPAATDQPTARERELQAQVEAQAGQIRRLEADHADRYRDVVAAHAALDKADVSDGGPLYMRIRILANRQSSPLSPKILGIVAQILAGMEHAIENSDTVRIQDVRALRIALGIES